MIATLILAGALATGPALSDQVLRLCDDAGNQKVMRQCPAPPEVVPAKSDQDEDWLERAVDAYCLALGANFVRGPLCLWTTNPWSGGPR